MTILTLNKKQLEKKIGRVDSKMEDKISMFGTPVEGVTDTEFAVEVFPNRPDLLSLQGFTRALRSYLYSKRQPEYKVNSLEQNYEVKIEKSVKRVRPYTACAIVKNLKLDDNKIKEIIDLQEKLHTTIGRKRKKAAIGIYPLEKIKLPIRFTAKKPDDIKFIPLEFEKELTGKQILRQHPAGREYAHLLQHEDVYPIFIDANDKILSMPPIINSHETGRITDRTRDVFIECSGSNLEYLKKTLNIIVTTLADMGGKIYSMNITGTDKYTTPNLEPEKLKFRIEDINKTLGMNFSEKEIKKYFEKMGLEYKNQNNQSIAIIPAYRTDILHWIDLTEEIAIAHGYDNFVPELPEISTVGEEDKKAIKKRHISEILSGLDLLETSSFHLAKKLNIKKMHYEFKDFIEVEDSKTEYSVLRIDILSNLLKIFSENSDSPYPQKMFELGKVFTKNPEKETSIDEKEALAVAVCSERVNFTELKQILDYLFKMIDHSYKLESCENSNYISGRVAKVLVDKNPIGYIGELAPSILKNWKISFPVSGFEIDLDWLLE